MKAPAVAKLLRELGLPDVMNPYGFPIAENTRLERGSGIGGRTDWWRIVVVRTDPNAPNCEIPEIVKESPYDDARYVYKKDLKRALLAWKRAKLR